MKCNFINIKLNDKRNINLYNKKTLELFKLSVGNNIINLKYNKNKKESSCKNLEISYYKKIIKKNIGIMIYENFEGDKKIKIFNKVFISNNIKNVKIIIKNKQFEIKEIVGIQNQYFKIKIKFLDNIFYLNSMFRGCKSLISVYNFQNINSKYLKNITKLFGGCSSLLYIDDISNWNLDNVNNIGGLFGGCSSLTSLPNISNWNISNVHNIAGLFYKCSSLKTLPDISKWNTSNISDMSLLFCECSSLKLLPDISKWNLSNTNNIFGMFDGCSLLEEISDISNWI